MAQAAAGLTWRTRLLRWLGCRWCGLRRRHWFLVSFEEPRRMVMVCCLCGYRPAPGWLMGPTDHEPEEG